MSKEELLNENSIVSSLLIAINLGEVHAYYVQRKSKTRELVKK
ncbi:hypothetical protein [Clostridium estertheticum]|nr:hypothetical protein [Clostridium estertheticum]